MRNHLLFLHDLRIPATNNEAERLLRNYKRKQAQADQSAPADEVFARLIGEIEDGRMGQPGKAVGKNDN